MMTTEELIARAEEREAAGHALDCLFIVPDLIAALRAERAARERAEAALAATAEREADICTRMVAASLEGAADAIRRLDTVWHDGISADAHRNTPEQMRMYAVQCVLARIPDDAQAALDRIRQKAANEALERAAVIIEGSSYVTGIGGSRTLEPVSTALKGMDQHHATIAAAIRALKGGA